MSEVARMCLVATVLSSLNGEVTNVLLALFQGCLSHTLGLRTLTIIMSRKKTFEQHNIPHIHHRWHLLHSSCCPQTQFRHDSTQSDSH